MVTSLSLEEILFYGYKIVSRKFRHAARIDSPDWIEQTCRHFEITLLQFSNDNRNICYNDHYRRCFSRDTIIVPSEWIMIIGNSGFDFTGYVYKIGDELKYLKTKDF